MIALTKSRHLEGQSCLKKLSLSTCHPELRPPLKDSDRRRMEVGKEIGELARTLFPDGVLAPYVGLTDADAAEATQERMREGYDVIFEATFVAEDLAVRVDVLKREAGGWRILEAKSSSVYDKAKHLVDVAFQVFVARASGTEIVGASMIHMNRNFRFGDSLDSLLRIVSIDEDVDDELQRLPELIALEREVLSSAALPIPDPCPNSSCRSCDFRDHCLPQLPSDHLYFTGLHHSRQKKLRALGVTRASEIPVDQELKGPDQLRVDALLTGQPQVSPLLSGELDKLTYPLYLIDFETIAPEIPRYEGTSPYQVIPFQWSCHIVESKEALLAGVSTHREFIYRATDDPRREFAESLLACLGDHGSVLHYSNFEIQVVKQLAASGVPGGDELLALVSPRFVDLEIIVKNGFAHPKMQGRSSIKRVLPALDCKLSYKNLAVQDGDMAIVAYLRTLDPTCNHEEREQIFAELLEYCELDTYAMVYVLERLLEFSSKG